MNKPLRGREGLWLWHVRSVDQWLGRVSGCLDHAYTRIHAESLRAIHVCVFVKRKLARGVVAVASDSIACGIGMGF